ncbi:MAG: DUF3494 domain-containing protein [Microbacteriaceae bacterium]|nr:DUF3494 domain-containing protein [Microbacteriaceae bacterium]
MKNFSSKISARRLTALALAVAVTVVLSTAPSARPAFAAEAPIALGTAESFAVLAGTTVTNTDTPTVISGDLGVSPDAAVTGFPPGLVNNGEIHAADAVAAGAQADLRIAFDDAAGRLPVESGIIDLTGRELVSGVYSGGALGLTGTVTLVGDSSSVFIFQAASTLITGSGSRVALQDDINPCNVFWQVGSSATIGSGSEFVGTVLALTSIAAQSSATVEGRLLARNGAVTLDANVITVPSDCASDTTEVDDTRVARPAVPVQGRATFTG